MSTADTNNPGIKLQAAGENLNTWGDPNLNNDLIVLSHLASGWNQITITGNYTVSANTTNYSTTNPDEYAAIKLVQGSVSAAFNFILAARAKRFLLWNATNYSCTVKLAATSGFTLPSGRWTLVATDGSTDAYNMAPNVGGVTSPVNLTDIPNWSAVQTAIATATVPAATGAILNSATDTTAGYLSQKIAVAGTGELTMATVNPAANENSTLTFTRDEGQIALYNRIFRL